MEDPVAPPSNRASPCLGQAPRSGSCEHQELAHYQRTQDRWKQSVYLCPGASP